ncbi:TonB-dependent receptor [Parasphingorhabdus sp.]|uniref:TonB-dependent receptor n=1 Tax=Parasphingorhabdus sp. TaxID=2709688 RepID=UPI0032EF2E38
MSFKISHFKLLCGVAACTFANPAFAQNTGEAAQQEETGGNVIIVTAQRRDQNLQDVPIAITAKTAENLTDAGINNSLDLQFVTPGLNFGTQLASAVPYIRGVGTQGTAAGNDSSVSTYVDDVYYSSSTGSVLSFPNVDRIEVLKGPQGTLFGRNATGGLVHIITKDPSFDFKGQAEISYGNYETIKGTAYLTGGLSENVAVDLAFSIADQGEGYGTNLFSGSDVNDTDELALRNKWLFNVGDNTEIKLAFDYSKVQTTAGTSLRLAPGALGVDGAATFGFLITPVAQGGGGLTPAQAAPIAAAAASRFTGDFQDADSSLDPFSEIEQWGVSLKIDHSFGDVDLTSISAYRDTDSLQQLAQAAIPFPGFLDVFLNQFTRTFTQELRLTSGTDNFDWIVGAYLLSEEAGYNPTRITGLALSPADTATDDNQQDTFSWALFAQGDYRITDDTTLTAGIRFTQDKRDLSGNTAVLGGGMIFASTDFTDSETWSEFTWRLALSHKFNDDTLGYISYNRGFKSGLFNLNVLNPAGPGPAVNPEILDAFEVGLKTEFLDNKVRLNTSAFYYQYKDLQVNITTPGGAQILNAAEASMYGGEIELLVAPTDGLTLNAGLSLLHATFDSFPSGRVLTPTGFGGNAQTAADLAGNDVPRSPEVTFSFGGVYDFDTSIGNFALSANYYYNDGFFWESDNVLAQNSYSVVNAQVTWTDPNDRFYVSIFGNNLTDEEYSSFGLASELGDFIAAAPPMTYGAKVGVKF